MSEAHGARRQKPSDLYRTPVPAIVPIVKSLQHISGAFLDPCEGDGRIKLALRAPGRSSVGFDLDPDYGPPVDFLKHHRPYDCICGNPPFSIKKEFIDHSLGLSRYTVFILPMSVVSYNEIHSGYLDIPEYMGRLLMTPKIIMNEAGSFKRKGVYSYAWFFWDTKCRTRGSWEYYWDMRKQCY